MINLQHQFGGAQYEPTFSGIFKFEIKSFIGRLLSPRFRKPQASMIHLGSGVNLKSGFENIDFYTKKSLIANFYPSRGDLKLVGHDLRYPLPYHAEVFEGAFSEHTLEHLTANQARNLLKEVRRILKPNSCFRVIVPDLKQYVDFYEGREVSSEFQKFATGSEAIWCLTHNWGHLSCWDAELLIKELLLAGFSSARMVGFQKGDFKQLMMDKEDRKWESVYVEAIA